MQNRIYVASRASAPGVAEMWKCFRYQGFNIISSWIDEAGNGETVSFAELWQRIRGEIQSCDLLVLYVGENHLPIKGALVEVGMALAFDKPIHVVVDSTIDFGSYGNRPIGSWIEHPNVEIFADILTALQATVIK